MERHSNHSRGDGLLLRSATAHSNHNTSSETRSHTTSPPDFVLQWGNRKRMRCMKFPAKDRCGGGGGGGGDNHHHINGQNDSAGSFPTLRTTVRIDRRVVRSDHNNKDSSQPSSSSAVINHNTSNIANGYLNLRQRPASPSQRILRNSDSSIAMRAHGNGVRGLASPDRGGAQDRKVNGNHHINNHSSKNHHHTNDNNNGSASSDSKKGGGSSSGSDAIPVVWPPKFVIALTNKEKEEDFLAIKGSKLPQRPKKRAKFIQRTLNLVSPGGWLCDLTLERYEVREKKVSKKRPRGLKAMGNVESDSES